MDAQRIVEAATRIDEQVFHIIERSSAGTHGRPAESRMRSWEQVLKRR
jgi:hypothetical protein